MMTLVRFDWRLTPGVVAIVFAVAAGLFLPRPVSAQTTTGGIRGIVHDAIGAVLPGVSVEATSPALIGGPTADVSNQQGLYRFERLPIGSYTVTFTLSGFRQLIRRGVEVEVGRAVDVDVTMSVSAVEESVTISAAAPVVDSLHAGTSTNFSQQLMEELPSARTSHFNLMAYAPAVRADLTFNTGISFVMYGASADQNSYQFEGIEYSTPTGYMWNRPNPDSLAELQLQSTGVSAESGGFQGGIVNEILRSGTDSWRGQVSYFYSNDSLTGNNTPTARNPYRIGYLSDFTGQFGGPLVKSRLWVNGMFERFDIHQVNVGIPLSLGPKTRRMKPTFKVNAKLSDRDSLDISYTDNYYFPAPGLSVLRTANESNIEKGHNPTFASHWYHTIGDRTVIEVKGGGIRDPGDYARPLSGDYTTPGHFDIGTGRFSVNTPSVSIYSLKNYSLGATVAHYADDFIKGSHDFKFGVQVTPAATEASSDILMSNTRYFDLNGQPYYALFRQPLVRADRGDNLGLFAQDNWVLTRRLTLNLGIRFDDLRASIPSADQYDTYGKKTGEKYPGLPENVARFDHISPRLGVTFKLDRDGRTVAKAHYGRYYGRLNARRFWELSPGSVISEYFYYNPATGRYDIPYYSVDPKANYAVDPNVKNQYTDQIYLGLERELSPGLGMNVSFVTKKEHNLIRVQDTQGVYTPQPFVDTFNGVTQTLTVYNLATPPSQSLFTTTNRPDFRQDYKTLVVDIKKRLSGRWQLQGSYQWERSLGYNTGAISIGSQNFSSTGVSGFGRDPNDLTNAYGPFYTASTHVLRAMTAFQLPAGFNLGVQESFESGRPYGRVITVRALRQGTRSILAEPRGAYRLPSTNSLQIRFGKDFGRPGARRVRLSVDVYNIFNVDTPLTVQNNSSQTAVPFGTTLSVVPPRQAQVGIRYEF